MKKTFLSVNFSLFALAKEHCYSLSMSGGGNNGAWEAGVIWGLAHYGPEENYYWDVVSGVSAGSINTAYMSVYAPEDVKQMSEEMSMLW